MSFATNSGCGRDHENSGVSCQVESCTYYRQGHRCAADTINVSARATGAHHSDETCCRTFRAK